MAEIITMFICLIGAVYVYQRERRGDSVWKSLWRGRVK